MFLHQLEKEFEALSSFTHEHLSQVMMNVKPSIKEIAPYLVEPEILEYGRNVIYKNQHVEVIVVYLPPMTKTLVHDHGKSVGCVYVVKGQLLNIVYREKANPYESTLFSEGDSFHVIGNTIHMMFNPSLTPTITFHIYSPPLNGGKLYTPDL